MARVRAKEESAGPLTWLGDGCLTVGAQQVKAGTVLAVELADGERWIEGRAVPTRSMEFPLELTVGVRCERRGGAYVETGGRLLIPARTSCRVVGVDLRAPDVPTVPKRYAARAARKE